MTALLLAPALALGLAASAAEPGQTVTQVLNLSCVEALVAVGRPELAGVFSFVKESDAPMAFADFVARDKKAFKKFFGKLEADAKLAMSLTAWDHLAVTALVSLHGSPLGETLDHKPAPVQIQRLAELSQLPTITLEQMTSMRRK